MDELKDELKLMIAVGVWASVADGNVERMETSTLLNHLIDKSEEELDAEVVTEEIATWLSEFTDDFETAEKILSEKIKACRNLAIVKEDFIDIAQRVIVCDEELSDQEEVALARLHQWIGVE